MFKIKSSAVLAISLLLVPQTFLGMTDNTRDKEIEKIEQKIEMCVERSHLNELCIMVSNTIPALFWGFISLTSLRTRNETVASSIFFTHVFLLFAAPLLNIIITYKKINELEKQRTKLIREKMQLKRRSNLLAAT